MEMFKIFLILIFTFKFNPGRNVLLCSNIHTHMIFIQLVWTILETNLLLRMKSKGKRTFAQSLTITELRNFLRLELEITGEEMGSEKKSIKEE